MAIHGTLRRSTMGFVIFLISVFLLFVTFYGLLAILLAILWGLWWGLKAVVMWCVARLR